MTTLNPYLENIPQTRANELRKKKLKEFLTRKKIKVNVMNEECAALMNVLFLHNAFGTSLVSSFFFRNVYIFIILTKFPSSQRPKRKQERRQTKRIYDQIKNVQARY